MLEKTARLLDDINESLKCAVYWLDFAREWTDESDEQLVALVHAMEDIGIALEELPRDEARVEVSERDVVADIARMCEGSLFLSELFGIDDEVGFVGHLIISQGNLKRAHEYLGYYLDNFDLSFME